MNSLKVVTTVPTLCRCPSLTTTAKWAPILLLNRYFLTRTLNSFIKRRVFIFAFADPYTSQAVFASTIGISNYLFFAQEGSAFPCALSIARDCRVKITICHLWLSPRTYKSYSNCKIATCVCTYKWVRTVKSAYGEHERTAVCRALLNQLRSRTFQPRTINFMAMKKEYSITFIAARIIHN
jgi:hypothetical protein